MKFPEGSDYAPPPQLIFLANILKGAGTALYAVGGLPRNAILGLPPSDIDVCSALRPGEICAVLAENNIRFVEKAPLLGTVEIHIENEIFEHTTFRKDVYNDGGGHRPKRVEFGNSLNDDAMRRDFTCNALYADVLTGALYDPVGGVKDIKKKLLRATSKDPSLIMKDDGLRVMRLARFACELGFMPEKRTFSAAKRYAAGLDDISWERKRDELVKLIMSDTKYPSLESVSDHPVLLGLNMLYSLGALEYCVPELLEGDGVPQRASYHAYDVMRHNFHACAATPAELVLRLAGLLHDVGKPAALRANGLSLDAGGYNEKPPGLGKHKTPMLGHDTLGADMAGEILQRLRFSKAIINEAVFLIENHMYDLQAKAKENTLRTRFCEFGYDRALALCSIREADVLGSGKCHAFSMLTWRDLLARMKSENAPFSLSELNCTGKDVMEWLNLAPGREVGEIMRRMLLHCARFPADNTRARLCRLAPGMMNALPEYMKAPPE